MKTTTLKNSTSKRTFRTAPKTHDLPVSKKFYADIVRRVEESSAIVGICDPEFNKTIITAINIYMKTGKIPAETDGFRVILLVFHLLKPEIDKAVERSRRARRRNATKRACQPQQEPAQQSITSEEPEIQAITSNKPADEMLENKMTGAPLNRSQRRRMRREHKKAKRRNQNIS